MKIVCKSCGKIARSDSEYWNKWFEFTDKDGELQPYCPICGKSQKDQGGAN